MTKPKFIEDDAPEIFITNKDKDDNYSRLMFEIPALQSQSVLNNAILKYYLATEMILSTKSADATPTQTSYDLYFGSQIGDDVFILAVYEQDACFPVNLIFLRADVFKKWLQPDANIAPVEPEADVWEVYDARDFCRVTMAEKSVSLFLIADVATFETTALAVVKHLGHLKTAKAYSFIFQSHESVGSSEESDDEESVADDEMPVIALTPAQKAALTRQQNKNKQKSKEVLPRAGNLLKGTHHPIIDVGAIVNKVKVNLSNKKNKGKDAKPKGNKRKSAGGQGKAEKVAKPPKTKLKTQVKQESEGSEESEDSVAEDKRALIQKPPTRKVTAAAKPLSNSSRLDELEEDKAKHDFFQKRRMDDILYFKEIKSLNSQDEQPLHMKKSAQGEQVSTQQVSLSMIHENLELT
jgi:hypothetical protein